MTRVQGGHHSEICPQKFGSEEMDRVMLNVGGQRHETYLSTIGHLPDTRLYWIIESAVKSSDYDPETSEIFFDRHPGVFSQILNYYRTGKLHCPTDVCGPLFEQELSYWGVDEKEMEPCCWANYTQHRDAEENLKNVLYESTSEDPVAESSLAPQPSEPMLLWKRIQPPVWAILDESRSSKRAKVFSVISVGFIILSVTLFCINTIPELNSNHRWSTWSNLVERICGIFFTIEFVLRVVFCPNKRMFAVKWTTWVDFFAVVPFYLKLFITGADNFLNILLVFRSLRLFRFFRLVYGLQVLSHTLKASSYELILLLFMLFIPVVIFSSIMFFIEDNLDKGNTKFRSIPHSFWWSLITITTVGYGDIYPVSWPGKIVGCMCAICGVLIVALPVSIIGGNFSLFYTHAQARLKLPKKKNRVFLPQSSSAIYTEKRLKRGRAIRRKISSRPSDTNSSQYELGRMSSTHRSSVTCNGYPRRGYSQPSSWANEDAELYSPGERKSLRKNISSVSIKLPMNDQRQFKEREDRCPGVRTSLSMPDQNYSRMDPESAPSVVFRRSHEIDYIPEPPRISPINGIGNAGILSENYMPDFENEEEHETNVSPETAPLILNTWVKSTETDNNNFRKTCLQDNERDDVVHNVPEIGQDSRENFDANIDDTHSMENFRKEEGPFRTSPSCISETKVKIDCGKIGIPVENLMSDDANSDDSVSFDLPREDIKFNRRRRDPVF